MNRIDFSKYTYIVGYGIGQYYEYIKQKMDLKIKFDFLSDINWKEISPRKDGIDVISPEELSQLKNVLVVIFSGSSRNYKSICSVIENMGHDYIHINSIIGADYSITGRELKGKIAPYKDGMNNIIEYFDDIEDTITVQLNGSNNHIVIGRNVRIGSLHIECGNNVEISIGDNSEIVEAKIFATDGQVTIGEDCLLAGNVIIRNNDSHHIFNSATGKRINYPGNICIGNHVWVGYGATILGNFNVGCNSIVGTMAVSSSSFPDEVIIAGNPAKIIREQVCWSKDNTGFFNNDCLEECKDRSAEKYIKHT